jgi:O-antigen/teichoic acid export membrane protein
LSNMTRKLTSGSALRVLNLGAQLVASLILMPFVIGCLGDRIYGLWVLVSKIIDYYGLLDLGITAAVSRHIAGAIGAQDTKQCNQVVSNALALYTGVAVIVAAATMGLILTAPLIAKNTEDVVLFQKIILVLGLNTAVEFPVRVFGGILTAQLRYDIMSFLKIGSLILRISGIFALLSLGYGIFSLALVTVVAGIPEKIAYIYFAKRHYPELHISLNYLSRKTIRILYGFGLFVVLIQIGDLIKFNIDSLIIASFVGMASVTHYGIASTLMMNFMTLMGTVMGVFVPVFSRLEAEKNTIRTKKAFFLSTKLAICISSFVGFGLIAWGRFFIERWMGPDYLDAYPCLVFLIVGCTVSQWHSASYAILYGTSKHKFYAIANGAEAVLNLGLSLLLVRWYGIIGVAIGTMVPILMIKLFVLPVYVCRLTSMPFNEYIFEAGRTLGIVLISLIIPAILSLSFGAAEYIRLIMIGIVSGLLYFSGIWMFVFNTEESKILKGSVIPP